MSDDWQVGDLALCVGRHPMYPERVRPGALLTVSYIWHGCMDAADPSFISTALDFREVERMADEICYWAGNFRRIPPHIPDAEDRQTIDLLNRAPQPVAA